MAGTSEAEDRILALLGELMKAVQAGEADRIASLAREALGAIAREEGDLGRLRRQVERLMSLLPPEPGGEPGPSLVPFGVGPGRIDRVAAGPIRVELDGGTTAPDGGVVYPVWFGTNRVPAADGTGFTAARGREVHRGRVDVFVPKAHRFGETGTPLWRRLLRGDLRDDRLRVQDLAQLEREAFYGEIGEVMRAARLGGEPAQALVYLHGFNVSFEEAAIRAAQLGYDLKIPGATAFFSWPSRGSVFAYPTDEATIEASERAIADFLVEFRGRCGADRVHLVAHSMGNRGLLRALQRIAADAEARTRVRFDQVFLAAPDVDRDVFLDLVAELHDRYPGFAARATLYASGADRAVHASMRVHGAPRAGYFEPYTVAPGVDTVAVPDFDVDLLGHGYYAAAEALLYDLVELIRHGAEPARRTRLEPAVQGELSFWRLRR